MKPVTWFTIIFFFGFVSFWTTSFRFGYRPQSWRMRGAAQALNIAAEKCFTGNDNDRTKFMVCAQKKLNVEIRRWGLVALMDALAERLAQNKVVATQCHDLAHAIGWAGIMSTRSLAATIPTCTNTCVYGCGHGAMAAWYALGQDILGNLPRLCMEGIDWTGNPQGLQGCFHELGHAVTSIAGNDIKKALGYCDQIALTGHLDCAAGVFMEMFEPATFAVARQPLPANHPHWCEDLWEPYRGFCYEQAGVNEYGYHQNDIEAFAVCNQVPKEHTASCFQLLGQNIFYVYQHKANHMKATEEFCREMGEPWFGVCISGILNSSVAAEPTVSGGIELCQGLTGSEKQSCLKQLGDILKNARSQEQHRSICSGLPLGDREFCLEGSR